MPRDRLQRLAPTAAVVLVALLAGLSLGSGLLVLRHFRADATATSRLYSGVFGGLNDPRPGAEAEALLRLGAQVRALGLPLVVTDKTGRVTAAANLAVRGRRSTILGSRPTPRASTGRILRSWTRPSARCTTGRLPAQRNLTALAVLQGLTIAVMVAVAVFAYRNAMAAQRDRLWVAMAREAAHQMGTPLTSLQGWIERVRVPAHAAGRILPTTWPPTRSGSTGWPSGSSASAIRPSASRWRSARWPIAWPVTSGRGCRKRANPIELGSSARGIGPMVVGDRCCSSGRWNRW